MTIQAVNTLEIRFSKIPNIKFDRALLANNIETLQRADGCLGYTLHRSQTEKALWILCGYWHSEVQMTEHFASHEMTYLVNTLIDAGANLTFASMVPQAEQVPAHAH
ncbi:antibiotic biosynthesis monooxygenase [Pseudomonas sp. NPDC089734]|uniref:antibiotic biosynthesis monooxygenase n=1 Tax=Pseudomonas sp. NPDC089734 TaxID=3364469 RepID=UPI0038182B8E